jgi:hypothetical protein
MPGGWWNDAAEREEMSAANRRYADWSLPSRDSRNFTLSLEGEEHEIRFVRGRFDLIGPRIEIDGEPAGRIVRPTSRRTFTERDFTIAGHDIVATLADNDDGPDPIADVFIDGRSVEDGRSIEDVRGEAPANETLVGSFVGSFKGVPRLEVGDGEGCSWILLVAAIFVAAIGLLLLVVDVVLIVAGAVMAFWAANTIPGRRSVIDAIAWRLLAAETALMVTLILAAAWLIRH